MSNSRVSRRSFIGSAALIAGAAAVPAMIGSRAALAQQKVPQASVKYQEKPNGDQKCGNCLQFVAGSSPTAKGSCKVVDGAIDPNGWCQIWVKKP